MGLKTKQVSGDQGLDWGQTLLKSGTAELSKPPFTRPQQPPQQKYSEPLNCPRCGSTNTKFCYYNNYNKSQPRHFCKSCKRHWTKGGTLRNVPAGGGRKNKRPKTSNTTITTTTTTTATATATAAIAKVPTNLEPRKRHVQKNMSNILYQGLIHSSSPSLHNTTDGINMSIPVKPFLESNGTINTTGLNASAPQNPNTEFPFSSFSSTSFEVNDTSMINPTSFQSSNDHIDHDYAKNLDSMEESTITTLDIPMALSNYYWHWNEINELASSAGLNTAWNDVYAEINKSLD